MNIPKPISKPALQFVSFALVFSLLSLSLAFIPIGNLTLFSIMHKPASAQIGCTVIIDAGHGGIDGGAYGGSADSPVPEKDLNLAVAEKLRLILTLAGIDCVMTRSDDRMLGEGKAYDLLNRLNIARETENPVFVSIHMNKFPQTSCRGLQVYYSPNDGGSEALALYIQNISKRHIDPDNDRKIKRADSSIYLLDRIKTPAVLVECGFLSNPDELSLLTTEEYQQKIAAAIYSALAEYIGQTSTL